MTDFLIGVVIGFIPALCIAVSMADKYEAQLKRIDIATNFRFRGRV